MVKATLPGVALALATLTGAALATAPYDFAGHWTGNAQETGKSAVMLTADFTMAGARTFSGTLAVADGDQPMQCTVNAKVRRRVNVALRGACADGGTLRLRGRANPDKQTIAGTFVEKRERRRHRGRFVLGKPAGAAHARILHGPSRSASSAVLSALGVPADGHWGLSPDQGRVTLTSLTFQAADGPRQVDLVGCTPTYTRDAAALAPLLDCPFDLLTGTYVGLTVGVSTRFEVLIDDSLNGFYTDPASPTGLSTTPPAGGAQFVSFVVPGPGGAGAVLSLQTFFTSPLVVDAGTDVSLDIVDDMIHTVFANVAGGTASFDTSLPLPAVQLVPSVSGAGKVEFYSPTGTALDALMPGPTDDESGSVRVFYASPGQPSYVFSPVPGPSQAWNVSPASSPANDGFRAGGYLGLDASGTLCWALPTDYTYAQYSELCEMPVVATVGSTTTLSCQHLSSVPPPVSGDTYASGCPPITPDEQRSLTLVAN